MKKYSYVLSVLTLATILFLVFGNLFLNREAQGLDRNCSTLDTEWYRIMDDGSAEPVEMPGSVDIPAGEELVLTCTLPDIPADGYRLLFRSSQQDMYIYIDGDLRAVYDTADTRIWGESSMSCNVFADVSDADSGRELKLVTQSSTSYNGVINSVYLGTPDGILWFLLRHYAVGVVVAVLLLSASVLATLICIFLQHKYHMIFPMTYAAWTGMIVSLQAIVESKLRQYYVGNMTVTGGTSYFLVGLIPIALGLYIDVIQDHRYEKVFKVLLTLCVINSIVNIILQITGIQDFLASMTRSYVLFFASFVLWAVTTVIDIRRGKFKENVTPSFGIMMAYLMGFTEIIASLLHYLTVTGLFMNIGIFMLLFTAVIDSIRQIAGINAERMEAIAANRAKSGFLANMSHEIRSPINAILGMNEMIIRETSEDEIRQYACNVNEAGNSLLSIINDILDFSKIESGRMQITEVEYSLSRMFRDLVNLIKGRAEDGNLKLNIDIDEKLPETLFGDDVRVKQVVLNLLTNAVKYTEKGSVTLFAQRQELTPEEKEKLTPEDAAGMINLHIEVRDTGIGIKQEDMAKLFENFERLDLKHNRSVEGTGLGLSISSNLVRLMNGHMSVSSVYGSGSVFAVDIPQKLTDDGALIGTFRLEEIGTDETVKEYRESFHAPGAHILVVDDSAINLKVILSLLKRTGMHVDTALSGKQCIEMCKKKNYDLILMDHMMPEMDGIETLDRLLEEDLISCPVAALTANAMSGMEEMYISKGFSCYISKPVKPDLLEKSIREMLPAGKVEILS